MLRIFPLVTICETMSMVAMWEGLNAAREYCAIGDRALRMVCKPSFDWEA